MKGCGRQLATTVQLLEGRLLDEIISIGHTIEETAYHEAGHAAIELIYGFTPQILVLQEWPKGVSGGCYSCSPIGPEHAAWRGEKAVAGVLAQALYIAGQRLELAFCLIPEIAIDEMLKFFMTCPTPTHACTLSMSDEQGIEACQVDLRGCYSLQDYQHFRISIAEQTQTKIEKRRFIGTEPECRVAARECILHCLIHLNNRFVWQNIKALAEAILNSAPSMTRLLDRDGIEGAAMMLHHYDRRFLHNQE